MNVVVSITGWAQETLLAQRMIVEEQRIDTNTAIIVNNSSIENLDGVAFPPGANTLLTLNQKNNSSLTLVDTERDGTPIKDIPFFNIAYDGTSSDSEANGSKNVFIVINNELLRSCYEINFTT